jgi:hypothetical protein
VKKSTLVVSLVVAGALLTSPAAQAVSLGDAAGGSTISAASKPYRFANCKALNKKFPHGVATKGARDHTARGKAPVRNFTVNKAWYLKNKGLDRDHDGIACEKK